MSKLVQEFKEYRSKMNEKLLADNNKEFKQILNMDINASCERRVNLNCLLSIFY